MTPRETPTPDSVHVSQVKGNFNRLARDLDRAFRASGFTGVERVVIDEARELSWSFAGDEPDPFAPNFSAMARVLGHVRQVLSKTFHELVAMRVFLALGDGTHLINKDYREWLDKNGLPRLSPEQVAWCLEITRNNRKGRTATKGLHPLQPLDCTPCNLEVAPLQPLDCTPCNLEVAPIPAPLIGTGASEELRENKKSGEEQHNTASRCSDDRPELRYPVEDGPLDIHTGPHPIDPVASKAIFDLLWRTWGNERLCNGFYEHQCWYRAEHWRSAIRDAARRGKQPNTIGYLERIAGDHEANGIPNDSPPAPGQRRGPRSAPPPIFRATTPPKRDRTTPTREEINRRHAEVMARLEAEGNAPPPRPDVAGPPDVRSHVAELSPHLDRSDASSEVS